MKIIDSVWEKENLGVTSKEIIIDMNDGFDDVKNGLLFETNTTKSKRGGYRKGSGRPATGRTRAITIRVSEEAVKILNTLGVNKSEYIDNLIRKA